MVPGDWDLTNRQSNYTNSLVSVNSKKRDSHQRHSPGFLSPRLEQYAVDFDSPETRHNFPGLKVGYWI